MSDINALDLNLNLKPMYRNALEKKYPEWKSSDDGSVYISNEDW